MGVSLIYPGLKGKKTQKFNEDQAHKTLRQIKCCRRVWNGKESEAEIDLLCTTGDMTDTYTYTPQVTHQSTTTLLRGIPQAWGKL